MIGAPMSANVDSNLSEQGQVSLFRAADPLPAWNDGATKQAILDYNLCVHYGDRGAL